MRNTFSHSLTVPNKDSVEIVDLLASQPSDEPFLIRVAHLQLSRQLEQKVHLASSGQTTTKTPQLTSAEEKELATEVLLLRHAFTELVWRTPRFNQAALTIIQNIYLFKQRKIFFDPSGPLYEEERREALLLFTTQNESCSLPLSKTFQHLILARVWSRIRSQSTPDDYNLKSMRQLLKIVEKLNTIRNIYVLLTTGLVKKLSSQLSEIYQEGITQEDAQQIGLFGVARAAYRYHPSSGVRFSTFAGNWIKKELQRQALDGRLIRISSNIVECYTKALRKDDQEEMKRYSTLLTNNSCRQQETSDVQMEQGFSSYGVTSDQETLFEINENSQRLHLALSSLSEREGDFIRRRFGLSPHSGEPQSIISISKLYGVTRSSMYQLENKALEKLRKALVKKETCYC